MPGTKKLRFFVIQATLVAFGCFLLYFASAFSLPGFAIASLLISCYWLVLAGIAVRRFRWHGLWVLLGAPLALQLPYEILRHFLRCYHSFCID
jgi:hypothetical protein